MRNIKGIVGAVIAIVLADGAFKMESNNVIMVSNSIGYGVQKTDMDVSRVVPTGVENAPRTLSVVYWRRIS